jgi:hypothetical protein
MLWVKLQFTGQVSRKGIPLENGQKDFLKISQIIFLFRKMFYLCKEIKSSKKY